MALTISNVVNDATQAKRIVYATLAFDDSYPTGGEPLTANNLGLMQIDFMFIESAAGYTFEYDKTNSKVLVYAPVNVVAGDGSADANNTILKSATATLEVGGTGTAFQLAGVEVLSTTDLSALTGVQIMAYGA